MTDTDLPTAPAWIAVALPRHEDRIDASLEAVAFVCGKGFAEVRADFDGLSSARGIDMATLGTYLAGHGLATQVVNVHDPFARARRQAWPLAPWADVHILQAEDADGPMRFVVLKADGSVLDALADGPRCVEDYERVTYMAGVHHVGRGPRPTPAA